MHKGSHMNVAANLLILPPILELTQNQHISFTSAPWAKLPAKQLEGRPPVAHAHHGTKP